MDVAGVRPTGVSLVYGSSERILEIADRALAGQPGTRDHIGALILAANIGRTKGFGMAVNGMNMNPLLLIGSAGWAILSKHGDRVIAEGGISELQGVGKGTSGGNFPLRLVLTNNRALGMAPGAFSIEKVKQAVPAAIAIARRLAAPHPTLAPGQSPVAVEGIYLGGYGNPFQQNDEAHLAIDGNGVSAFTQSESFDRSFDGLLGIQLGGAGEYTTGGGWFGGGLGVKGALEGAAFATVMNALTTKQHIDCIARLAWADAEMTFAVTNRPPRQLELDLAALLAALRGGATGTTLPLTTVGGARPSAIEQTNVHGTAPTRANAFCTGCGRAGAPGDTFCGGCGRKRS